MKSIPLTQGKFALVDDDDFERVNKYKWCISSYRYANNKNLGKMHRFILNINNPKIWIDHKDQNTFNNQKSNLRVATVSQNNSNINKNRKNNKSGYRGVGYHKTVRKWRARVNCNNKQYNLGWFNTAEEAAQAYDKKARELFREFTGLLNFPND